MAHKCQNFYDFMMFETHVFTSGKLCPKFSFLLVGNYTASFFVIAGLNKDHPRFTLVEDKSF